MISKIYPSKQYIKYKSMPLAETIPIDLLRATAKDNFHNLFLMLTTKFLFYIIDTTDLAKLSPPKGVVDGERPLIFLLTRHKFLDKPVSRLHLRQMRRNSRHRLWHIGYTSMFRAKMRNICTKVLTIRF